MINNNPMMINGYRVVSSIHVPVTHKVERQLPVFKLRPGGPWSAKTRREFDTWLAATFGLDKTEPVMVEEPCLYVSEVPEKAIYVHPTHYPGLVFAMSLHTQL